MGLVVRHAVPDLELPNPPAQRLKQPPWENARQPGKRPKKQQKPTQPSRCTHRGPKSVPRGPKSSSSRLQNKNCTDPDQSQSGRYLYTEHCQCWMKLLENSCIGVSLNVYVLSESNSIKHMIYLSLYNLFL